MVKRMETKNIFNDPIYKSLLKMKSDILLNTIPNLIRLINGKIDYVYDDSIVDLLDKLDKMIIDRVQRIKNK